MTRAVIVRTEAKRDIREAAFWYRSISIRLRRAFLADLDTVIALIVDHPEAFPVRYRSFRRAFLRRFPYAIFYELSETRIAVVAVLHQARDQAELEAR